MNSEFYQSPEFLNAVAACTVALLGILFIIGLHPFKRKKRLVLSVATDENMWTAGDYFTFLTSIIRSSPTLEELSETMPLIEGFFDKAYRVPISNYQLKRYYSRLLEVYCNREKELDSIPMVICKN
jgi:hypothetical protein